MINLNTAKEIIKVESWSDITSRPAFDGALNPNEHKLKEIIGRYAFGDRVRCGLSNCQQLHGKGYIVATDSGVETNIGKDCGKNYFGVDFETMSNKFDRDMTEKENREKLWSFRFRSESVAAQVRTLRSMEHGADWVYKTSRPLLDGGKDVPAMVVRTISALVRTRQPILTREREATDREVEQLEAERGRRLPRPQYVSEPFAELKGLEALYPENNLKTLLVIELEEQIKGLEQVDIDTLSYEQLRMWSKWLGSVDSTFEKATFALEKGRELLTHGNLQPLGEAAGLDSDGRVQFDRFLKPLPQ
jgi:hypothetical protein